MVVADAANNRLRKIDRRDRAVTTLAGDGLAGGWVTGRVWGHYVCSGTVRLGRAG